MRRSVERETPAESRPVRRAATLAAGALALLLSAGSGALGEVLMTEQAALARAFPGAEVARRSVFLTPEQRSAVERTARSKLPSALVTVFEARRGDVPVGRAVLDTGIVRTLPATVLTAITPDGRVAAAFVLRFAEPPDYLPREGWLRTLEGRPLDDELWPGRGVRRVTGATLTVQALSDAVRRALAIEAVVLRRPQ
jgi:hypothetical protein